MTYKKIFLLLLLSIAASVAQAKYASQYRFEIIIFEYTGQQDRSTETWPANPGYPDYSKAIFSISGNRDYAASSQDPSVNFRLLKPSQFILQKQANVIKRSSSRKLLLHRAWTQTMKSKKRAYPVSIKLGKSFSNQGDPYRNSQFGDTQQSSSMSPATLRQIEGTIKISIGRYLHVWTDLIHTAENAGLQVHRFQDHRRMRSKELHYIDNPNFGILIYALPVN